MVDVTQTTDANQNLYRDNGTLRRELEMAGTLRNRLFWWSRRITISQPLRCRRSVLPLNYPTFILYFWRLERARGIEPRSSVWKTEIITNI